MHYYLADDATRVGIALGQAEDAARGTTLRTAPRLAKLLDTALEHQIHPDQLRRTIPSREAAPIPGTDL